MKTFNVYAEIKVKLIAEVGSELQNENILDFADSFLWPNDLAEAFEVSDWQDICSNVAKIQILDDEHKSSKIWEKKAFFTTFIFGTLGVLSGAVLSFANLDYKVLWSTFLCLALLSVLPFLLKKRRIRSYFLNLFKLSRRDLFLDGTNLALLGSGYTYAFIDAENAEEALGQFKVALGLEEAQKDLKIVLGGAIFMEKVEELYRIDSNENQIGKNLYSAPVKVIKWMSSPAEVLTFSLPAAIFLLITLL